MQAVLSALERVPDLEVREAEVETAGARNWRPDARLFLSHHHQDLDLVIECKRALYPRDAREVIHRLKAYRSAQPGLKPSNVLMVAAEVISEGAREILRAEGAGYYQTGGTLFLSLPGLLVDVERPPAKSAPRPIRSLFNGTRVKVMHAILSRRDLMWGTTRLAEMAQVSPGTASQVLNELEQLEWADVHGRGPRKTRHVPDPGRVLDAWAKQAGSEPPLPLRRYFVPGRKDAALLREVAEAFEEAGVEYAFTHEAAGNQYSPFLTHVAQLRMRVRPGPALDKALGSLKARSVDEGANLALIDDADGAGLMFREKKQDGVWLASPYQTYIDLMRAAGQGRSKELAQHLRQEIIGI